MGCLLCSGFIRSLIHALLSITGQPDPLIALSPSHHLNHHGANRVAVLRAHIGRIPAEALSPDFDIGHELPALEDAVTVLLSDAMIIYLHDIVLQVQ